MSKITNDGLTDLAQDAL